jgi:hypothetical protein
MEGTRSYYATSYLGKLPCEILLCACATVAVVVYDLLLDSCCGKISYVRNKNYCCLSFVEIHKNMFFFSYFYLFVWASEGKAHRFLPSFLNYNR